MILVAGDATRYERWRGQWLDGADGVAIAVLRFHGLRRALALPGPAGRPALPGTACAAAEPVPARAVDEAAALVRQLVDTRLMDTKGENHHA